MRRSRWLSRMRRGSPDRSSSEARRVLIAGMITCYNFHMKVAVRRIGNSLGVIVPKPILKAWGVDEGDQLEVTARGIRPAARSGRSDQVLDELKRSIALAVVRQFTPNEIRAQILANLHRWRRQGAWVSAYDEWREIAERGDDGELLRRCSAATTMRQGYASRCRSSVCCPRRKYGGSMKKWQADHVLRAAHVPRSCSPWILGGVEPIRCRGGRVLRHTLFKASTAQAFFRGDIPADQQRRQSVHPQAWSPGLHSKVVRQRGHWLTTTLAF